MPHSLTLALSWWVALLPFPADPAEATARGFYLELPHVYQVDNYCGPAVLAMVLQYWGRSMDQHQLARHWTPFPKGGLSGAQLKETAVKHGFKAYSFAGNIKRVSKYLKKGIPVIAAVDSSGPANSSNHFVVLAGWDPTRQEWIVHDPAKGAYRRQRSRDFERRWAKLLHWSLVVAPAGRPPRPAERPSANDP